MKENEKYNGWTNYETWNFKLWIDNEESSYNYWNEEAQNIFNGSEADDIFTKKENAANSLADILKEYVQENIPDISGFYLDILQANLSEINYYEIAESLLEEVEEEE